MTMIQLIACIGMIAGLFMVLHVSPRELSDSLFSRLTAAPGSIRADINETTRRKKAGFLRREITEAQAVLAASGRADRFPMVCFTSLLCFSLGACIAIAAGNAFLVPVLAVGLMLTPFWYVKLTAGSFKKDVAAELETALSVITTAYLRTENFQQAVEENVRYLHPPVQEVFQHFLMRIKHIDPDMDAALTDLKAAIDNEVWREWCDAVMACQADRSLTSILTPIVSKLSDMRVVNAELENLVFGPRKLYLLGRDVPPDREQAKEWLIRSAVQGNEYARFFLDHFDQFRDPSVMLAATKLLHHMSRIFQNNSVPPGNPAGIRIDSKRRRRLMEKRMAMGHRADDHEEQTQYQQSM